ncbi:MAG: hypothetical protein WC564_02235 [Patescibacteria group bacterium]
MMLKLSTQDSAASIRVLLENIDVKYFILDKDNQKEIIDNIISCNSNSTDVIFSNYMRYNVDRFGDLDSNPFALNPDQISKIVNRAINYSPGDFLLNYSALSKSRDASPDEDKDAFIVLSQEQEEALVLSYVNHNYYGNPAHFQNIIDNYPDLLEKSLLKVISKDNVSPLIAIMNFCPEIASRVALNVKGLFLESLCGLYEDNRSHRRSALGLNVYKILQLLNKANLLTVSDLKKMENNLELEKNNRDKTLNFSIVFNSLLAVETDKNVDKVAGKEVFKEFKDFEKKYQTNCKGKNILTLVAAAEYSRAVESNKDSSFKAIFLNIAKRLKEYDFLLSAKAANIPAGLRVSIGMEYEVVSKISSGYFEHNNTNYKDDILLLTALGDLGQGNDADHEFATKPTDNPYIMLLEMKLLQDLDFIDFNFKDSDLGGYVGAATGIHLTIGGENDIKVNSQTNFLQNVVMAANLGGVYSGTEVRAVGRSRGSIRQRNSDSISKGNVKVFDKVNQSVELRAFSIDKWEQFERNILTNYHGAIGIQALEKYTNISNFSDLEPLIADMPETATSLYEFLKQNNLIKKDIVDERIKDIIYEWILVQVEMSRSVSDHNDNFLNNETSGYIDEHGAWRDVIDFARGRDNRSAFSAEIAKIMPNKSLEDYFQSNLKFNEVSDFFNEISVDMANKLTRINNLYLKGDQVNIQNMLNTTIKDGVADTDKKAPELSVFDNRGQVRKDRYYIQGSSDRLIINRAQDILLNFNEKMQKIIQKEVVESAELLAA